MDGPDIAPLEQCRNSLLTRPGSTKTLPRTRQALCWPAAAAELQRCLEARLRAERFRDAL